MVPTTLGPHLVQGTTADFEKRPQVITEFFQTGECILSTPLALEDPYAIFGINVPLQGTVSTIGPVARA